MPDERYCIYCGVAREEEAHQSACPFVTGVWPVRTEDARPCPHCGKDTVEICCVDCGASIEVGDHYALRAAGTVDDVICLGCAARLGLMA